LAFQATNGVTPDATQTFSLIVRSTPPAFTSANTATFSAGTGGTFTVSASGHPVPVLSETGTPPTGVSLGASSGGVATLTVGASTPAGTYSLAFRAVNGVIPNATQTFTLVINAGPDLALSMAYGWWGLAGSSFHPGFGNWYDLTVTNKGPTTSSGILTITDTLPSTVTNWPFFPLTGSWSCAGSGQTVTCTSAINLAPGQSSSMAFLVTVNAPVGTSVTNTATLTPLDANPSNNTATVTTPVVGAGF